MVYISRAT